MDKNIKENEIEKEKTFDKIKCPICNNPINWRKLDTGFSSNELICFVCECWSGDISKEMPRHIFRLKIFNSPEVEVDYGRTN